MRPRCSGLRRTASLLLAKAVWLPEAVRSDSFGVFATEEKYLQRLEPCGGRASEALCKAEPVECLWRPEKVPPCAPVATENCDGLGREDCEDFMQVCHWATQSNSNGSCWPGAQPCIDVKNRSACQNMQCTFRHEERDCVDRRAELCSELNRSSCIFYAAFCEWVGPSCKTRSVMSGGLATVITGTPTRIPGRIRHCVYKLHGKCVEAGPFYSLLSLVLLACAGCCSCCWWRRATASRSTERLTSLPPRRNPEFPLPPGIQSIVIAVPNECAPGSVFRFRHPNTGHVMEATAPADGCKMVRVHTAD